MVVDFIEWMKDDNKMGDGYLIPEPLLSAIHERPELLEGVSETEAGLLILFDGQEYRFYRVGYIFELMRNAEVNNAKK